MFKRLSLVIRLVKSKRGGGSEDTVATSSKYDEADEIESGPQMSQLYRSGSSNLDGMVESETTNQSDEWQVAESKDVTHHCSSSKIAKHIYILAKSTEITKIAGSA